MKSKLKKVGRAITFGLLTVASLGLGVAGLMLGPGALSVIGIISILSIASSVAWAGMDIRAITRISKPDSATTLPKKNRAERKVELKNAYNKRQAYINDCKNTIDKIKISKELEKPAKQFRIACANAYLKGVAPKPTPYKHAKRIAAVGTVLAVASTLLIGVAPIGDSVLTQYTEASASANESNQTIEFDQDDITNSLIGLGEGVTAIIGTGLAIHTAKKGKKEREDNIILQYGSKEKDKALEDLESSEGDLA